MKILVAFTGGTIGSSEQNGCISPSSNSKKVLINEYCLKNKEEVEFEFKEPYTILSENLSGDTLTNLMTFIEENLNGDADGIIITHGTDTLQYSAAAADYCFGNCHKPIVFVSANYPLEDERSNGHINFEAAVKFIKSGEKAGVFVSYSNDLKTVLLHRGCEVFRYREFSDENYSISGSLYEYLNGEIIKTNEGKELCFTPKNKGIRFINNPGILNVTAAPFENYNYSLENINGIILNPYHSGTLNSLSESFNNFCQSAKNKGIPIIVTFSANQKDYDGMQYYAQKGITIKRDVTTVMAQIMLWAEISQKN